MIECLRDDNGNITAVCEWLRINQDKQIDDDSKIVFIIEFEVNPEHKNNGVFKKLIRMVYAKNRDFEYVFWNRDKSGVKTYTRDQILKHIGG